MWKVLFIKYERYSYTPWTPFHVLVNIFCAGLSEDRTLVRKPDRPLLLTDSVIWLREILPQYNKMSNVTKTLSGLLGRGIEEAIEKEDIWCAISHIIH